MVKINSIQLLKSKVGHQRFRPKKNQFTYHVYYLVCPVVETEFKTPALFSFNRFNVLSLYTKDHATRNQTPWRDWIKAQLATENQTLNDDDYVELICHPRLFGYAFNPISYWIIYHQHQYPKAVICEVNNTFGDNHNYLLLPENSAPITAKTKFTAPKKLFVSPFTHLQKPAYYNFQFTINDDRFVSVIDYFEEDQHMLNTYISGDKKPLNSWRILGAVLAYPLMTILVVWRIHAQAIKLRLKGVKPTLHEKPDNYESGKTTAGKPTKD